MTILGKVRYNFKGIWQSSTSYLVNDTIIYLNRTYRCVSNHSNQTPPNVTYWELMSATMNDQGTWNSSTTYATGDVVLVDNGFFANTTSSRNWANTGQSGQLFMANTYICTTAHTNQIPPNSTYWSLLSQGNSKNHKAYLWAPNMGIVPAGFYPGNSSPGWANTSSVNARFGDSYYDGGLGWCGDGQSSSRPGWITRNGTVLTWGQTTNGSNGFGDNNNQAALNELSFPFNEYFDGSLPTPDGDLPKCIQWIRAWASDIVLFNNGEVYCWGYGANAGNASGNNNSINYPVRAGNNNNTQVLRGKKAIRIASTTWGPVTQANISPANYALMSDGTLWSWGYNAYGQLGLPGNTTVQNVPQQITTSSIIAGTSVVDIWAGGGDQGSLYILDNLGNMYACGRNDVGQLGINSTTDTSTLTLVKAWGTGAGRLKKFIIGNKNSQHYCAAVDVSGNLWTWGFNNYGQLGFDNTTNLSTPTQVSYNATNITNVWSSGGYGPFTITTRNTSAGNNQVYTCGNNTGWNLGRIQATSASLPLTLISGYSGEITHGQNGSSGALNSQGTAVGFVLNTYRFEAMQVEVSNSGTYYGNLTNVLYTSFYGNSENSNLFCVAGVYERSTGEKYWCGFQSLGQAGQYYYDSAWVAGSAGTSPSGFVIGNGNGTGDQFLARAISSSYGSGNFLGKRLRHMPTGLNETDFYVGWSTGLSYGTGLYWFDKYGNVYYSGNGAQVNSGNYPNMRYNIPTAISYMQKIPYMS
jgi:alpha-tubulin suppressor-like RCC1 family protein